MSESSRTRPSKSLYQRGPIPLIGLIARRPLLTLFLGALLIRVLIAVLLSAPFSGSLVLDNTTYHQMAADQAADATDHWDEQTYRLYWSTSAFMVPVTLLYDLWGANALIGQLFVALLGAITAVFVARTANEFIELRWAIFAGAVIALLPSQAFWSSMLMKDASVWFALTGLGVTAVAASHASGKRLAVLALPAAGCLIMLSYLRLHTLVVASIALISASLFGARQDWAPRVAGALLLGVAIPWVFGGIGPAGSELIANHGSLEERRFLNAQGAATAIVSTDTAGRDATNAGEQEAQVEQLEVGATRFQNRALRLEERAATMESENPTPALALRRRAEEFRRRALAQKAQAEELMAAIDDSPARPGGSEGAEGSVDPNLRHIPRGLSVMLLEPFPVPFSGSLSLRLARLESIVWYPLLVLSAVGLWAMRRHFRRMLFPLLAGGGIMLMYALSEGNIGTAHRHRGEFVWIIAVLAASGMRHMIRRRLGVSPANSVES